MVRGERGPFRYRFEFMLAWHFGTQHPHAGRKPALRAGLCVREKAD